MVDIELKNISKSYKKFKALDNISFKIKDKEYFILLGPTGAGKTTLAREVHGKLAEQAQVTTSFDLAADPLGLQRTTNPTIRNLIQDLVGLTKPDLTANL